jgi:hypothetical protein
MPIICDGYMLLLRENNMEKDLTINGIRSIKKAVKRIQWVNCLKCFLTLNFLSL